MARRAQMEKEQPERESDKGREGWKTASCQGSPRVAVAVDNLSIDIWTGPQRRILPTLTMHSSDEAVARYSSRSPRLRPVQEVFGWSV